MIGNSLDEIQTKAQQKTLLKRPSFHFKCEKMFGLRKKTQSYTAIARRKVDYTYIVQLRSHVSTTYYIYEISTRKLVYSGVGPLAARVPTTRTESKVSRRFSGSFHNK